MRRININHKLTVLIISVVLMAVAFHLRLWIFENFVLGYSLGGTQDIEKVLRIKGLDRRYIIHLPENFSGKEKLPVVFVLHGAGGNARLARESTGMNEMADREGFMAVYPNGTGLFNYVLSWNAGECCNFVEPLEVDDVGFFEKLVETLKAEYNIDEGRIYIAGVSNGGMMVYKLACELADEIAAIAPISAAMWIKDCNPSDFLSVVAFHGLADEMIPFDGGKSYSWLVNLFDLNFLSVDEAISFWAERDNCFSQSVERQDSELEKITFDSCENNSEVVLYKLKNAGHIWPGGKKLWILGDERVDYINASEIVWDFFANHPKIANN